MQQPERRGAQRGLLVRGAGRGCLSTPRVLDFLCFEAPPPVLGGEEGDEELPFYLASQGSLEEHVRQGVLPCPALWVDESALAGGSGALRVLYRFGGMMQHCMLPGKPIKLQPVKQGSAGGGGGSKQPPSGSSTSKQQQQGDVACRAFLPSRQHTQLYRLVVGLFPKLEQLHQELTSGGAVVLKGPAGKGPWSPVDTSAVTATPVRQGVLLERPDSGGGGEARQLTIAVDFAHACLVLRDSTAAAACSSPDCLRTVNCLAEALAVLHHETGRLGPPSATASPIKAAAAAAAGHVFQSPAKPPLPAAMGPGALRLAVGLVQECGSAQLREGLAILSSAAGNPAMSAAAIAQGAMEALITAAATVLPSPMMGMAELLPSIAVAVTSLLDAAPPAAYAAGRLVSILAAVLQQSCANPLLLCRLLVAVLERADVQAEAMRQGLAAPLADVYARMSPGAEAAAAELLPGHSGALPATSAATAGTSSTAERLSGQQQQLSALGFGSPLLDNQATGSSGKPGQVAVLVASYNAMSDSGSDCSPSVSRSASPTKGGAASPARSPSVLSNSGRFSVPRLALPSCDSPTHATGGLTRSTRRALGSTPGGGGGGARSPSPYGSPTRRSATRESAEPPAALAQLATLAGALGESLMAADLPAIVAHKRQADARLCEAAEEAEAEAAATVPAEVLEPPTGKKVLEGHRILVTARSLRSVDSSPSRTTDTDSSATAPAHSLSARQQLLDAEQTKCLLLRALLAALPLLDLPAGWPAKDPAPVLAAEVVGLLGRQSLSAAQEQLKGLALQALLRLSQRPTAPAGPQRASSNGGGSGGHVLVAAAGSRFNALAAEGKPEGGARAELLALLQLLTDYTTAVQHPSVAPAVMLHCLPGLQSLTGVLQAGGLDAACWTTPTWQLLHSLTLLLAAVCKKCEDGEAGRALLALLLADQQVASMLSGAASHMLLLPEQQLGGSLGQRARAAALQRDLLQLFAALAALVGRQPPCVQQPHHSRESDRAASRLSFASSAAAEEPSSSSSREAPPRPGPGQDLLLGLSARKGLTRRHALQFFGFVVSPHSGLAQRILDHDPAPPGAPAGAAGRGKRPKQQPGAAAATPASAGNLRLRQSLLEVLKAVFVAPGSPFAADKFVSDFYIRFHFIQFLKLYHNPHKDHQALFLCRQHMEALLVLAGDRSPHIRHRFHQLSVVDFFVRELSLEFEARQPARGRMHRLSSGGGSGLEHRRTSSSSTLASGWESGSASPVMSLRLPTVHEPEQQQQQRQQQPAGMSLGVPLLRLPSRGGSAGEGGAGSAASSPTLPLPAGIGGRGLAVPRLNLGPVPATASSPGARTPSPGNSARHGRPPLPPSARSGMAATPRLTSRLGRTMSARSGDNAAAAAAGPAAPPAAPQQQAGGLPAIATRQAKNSSAVPSLKLGIPKLGLAGLGRSLAAAAAAGAAAASAEQPSTAAALSLETRPQSRVHFSPTPSPSRQLPAGQDTNPDSDSDSSDSDIDPCGGAPGIGGRAVDAGGEGSGGGSQRQTLMGLDVPAGFTFTGDLEEDLDRLEALEEAEDEDTDADSERYGPESESASPTIPALRSTPFQQSSGHVPPLMLGLPRFKSQLSSSSAQQADQQGSDGERGVAQAGGGMAVPRLNLTHSMHSTLEARNASAEMQLAVECEQAKAKQGRGVLGELERSALGKGKMQAAAGARQPQHHHQQQQLLQQLQSSMSLSDIAGGAATAASDISYSEECCRRLLYRDEGLHLEVLQLVFTLICTPGTGGGAGSAGAGSAAAGGQLDPLYCDQYPWERKLQNIPFILYHHLNHEDNRPLLPHLLPRLAGGCAGSSGAPALRLLRLLCAAFFRPEWYSTRARISSAVGAYSTVYRASLPAWAGDGGSVVLKLVDTPKHIQDRCAQVDFAGEVSILEALAGSPRACQMFDYGVDPAADAMFLVLKDYRCSLRQWRARQVGPPAGQLRLFYAIFAEVAAAAAALLERGVAHFDLKCDNCLLEPLPGASEAEFWAPSSERLPFRVVLADFGESKVFSEGAADGAVTSRARGTDCFKSPEMLLVGGAAQREQRGYDRRRRQGAGAASDVWSLGCLLYELVAGKLLFSDSDWLQLVARVASPTMPLITEDKAAPVAGLPGMLDMLHFMLVRDARMRPTLADVQARLAAVRSSTRARLPPHVRASQVPLSSRGTPGGLHHSGSQLFSPTSYVPSPKGAMPMPLLAALPLSGQLVLAPLGLLGTPAALKQHAPRRVVLLFGTAAGSSLAGAAAGGSGVLSPTSSAGGSSSWASSPTGTRRYGGTLSAREQQRTFSANPVFSLGGSSLAGTPSTVAAQRTPARSLLTGSPRTALRFGSAAVHPEPEASGNSSASTADVLAAAAAAGGTAPRLLLGSATKVHPAHASPADSAGAQPLGLQLALPLQAPLLASARILGSGRAAEDAALLLRVLGDPELCAAAATCSAAGVECRLTPARPTGGERSLQQPAALAQWLATQALPLLNGGAGQALPVMLAVQPGCEAEGAMAAVAHLMQQRQVSLYQAMVAASQWGIDLHLRQHHLMALQHWAATSDSPSFSAGRTGGASWR